MEPEILERVVRLLPMRAAGHAIGDATAVLQTIATICRTLPSDSDHIARHLGPTNRAFWCEMVLRCFDFTIDRGVEFNVEDHSNSLGNLDKDAIDEYTRAAMDAWDAANPDMSPGEMLAQSLQYWKHLNAFFRPYQYGFLRKIQTGQLSRDAWPEHEDPFTLFCDLAMIKDKFDTFRDVMETSSDGQQFVYPVFLSAFHGRVKRADYPFLRHCGIIPHFWTVQWQPVSEPWDELSVEMDDSEEDGDDDDEEEEEQDEEMEEREEDDEEGEEEAEKHMEEGEHGEERMGGSSDDEGDESEDDEMDEAATDEVGDDFFVEYQEYAESSGEDEEEDNSDGDDQAYEDSTDEDEEERERVEEEQEDGSDHEEEDHDGSSSEEDDDEAYLVYDEFPFPYSTRKKLDLLQALRSGRWLGFCGQRDY
ncbi:hypothetical protein PINS_up018983 [Pythium insidiosum]|nr:hypothetical protein PINS_up018983 [Pythium insidiosum]